MQPTTTDSPWADADLDALKLSPEVAWYLESRGYPIPDCPPLIKTPEPREVPGARFDPERADKVVAAFRQLRHTKGRFAGQRFDPDVWQVAYMIAPVAGWVHRSVDSGDWVRIITIAYFEMPRKNGKSTTASGWGIYLTAADGEQGAQVVAAATTKEQAGFVFEPIRQIVNKSPGLKRYLRALKHRITHAASGSYFQPIANAGDAQHGADIHGAIVDELHLHKDMALIEALETGTGSREQPLIIYITTADAGKRHTPYDEKRQLIEKLARRVLNRPSTYGVVFAAEKPEYDKGKLIKGDDPFAESTWRKSNPGYGISPTKRSMVEAAEKAKDSPAELARFLRLRLGIRTKQETRYLDVDHWDINASIVVPERLKGRQCYGGLDLGSTSDLCALAWVFPNDDGTFDALLRHWAPEDSIEDLDERTAENATNWVSQGWLTTTPGNVTDYDFIEAQIGRDRDEFLVQEIAYDRWNAQQLINNLITDGAPMLTMGQGFASMSAPTKDLQRLIRIGARTDEDGLPVKPMIRHGGNPLLRWEIDNFAVAMDPAGNVKPDKANAGDKIDGVVALIMALSRALAAKETETRSAYADNDFVAL
ncbi:terminase large subunit [Mycobacteroides abscessus subsp. massiliense]|uniref:terminase large subunit n=1 Tax=Mycobacteroides abscessus TaxID=36809 RepID=UPI00192537F9|nr:terminase TerL endonuclease subunit [Mycobacteroides abscessus]MBL3743441.1 terminase large subunit [Mycobacteroides abscessus subsp. massiliense]